MWWFFGFLVFSIVLVCIDTVYHNYACRGKCTCVDKGDPYDYVDR